MRRHPLDSSSLASVGYDPRRRRLEVEFRTGHVYDYFDVPPSVYDEFCQAPSAGRFFTSSVRNRFRFQKVS
jgi:KTSC domain